MEPRTASHLLVEHELHALMLETSGVVMVDFMDR